MYCSDVDGLFIDLGSNHLTLKSGDFLFDCSKKSLECILLSIRNNSGSIPVGQSVTMEEKIPSIRMFKKSYSIAYMFLICVDLDLEKNSGTVGLQ